MSEASYKQIIYLQAEACWFKFLERIHHKEEQCGRENWAQLEAVSSFSSETSCNSILLNLKLCPFQDRIQVFNYNYPWMVSLSPGMMVLNAWAMFGAALSHPRLWLSTILLRPGSHFAYGSISVYQSAIFLLSCRSLVETCVVPILLYGCENWSLCDSSLKTLNSFLGELSKRVLRLPKWCSNTASMIVMDCLSAEARCLTRKLCFLRWITESSSHTLSSQTLFALSDDIESVCLIRECLGLEEHFNTNFTHSYLISSSNSELDKESRPSPRQINYYSVMVPNVF